MSPTCRHPPVEIGSCAYSLKNGVEVGARDHVFLDAHDVLTVMTPIWVHEPQGDIEISVVYVVSKSGPGLVCLEISVSSLEGVPLTLASHRVSARDVTLPHRAIAVLPGAHPGSLDVRLTLRRGPSDSYPCDIEICRIAVAPYQAKET